MEKEDIALSLLIALVVLGLFFAFSPAGLSEKGYSELLDGTMFALFLAPFKLAGVKTLLLFAAIASGILAYLFSTSFGNRISALLIALLVVFSSFVISGFIYGVSILSLFALSLFLFAVFLSRQESALKFAAAVPAFIGLLLVFPSLSFSPDNVVNFRNVGILLPIAIVALSETVRKKIISIEFIAFILGAALLFLSPALSIPLLVLASARPLAEFFNSQDKISWILLIFAFALFLSFNPLNPSSEILPSIALSATAVVIVYLILSLYDFQVSTSTPIIAIFLITLASGFALLPLYISPVPAPSDALIEGFRFDVVNDYSASTAITEFPNAYMYHTSKSPIMLTSNDLLSEVQLPYDYVILSSSSVFSMFGERMIAFRPVSTNTDPATGKQSVVLANRDLLLSVPILADGTSISGDGQLYDFSLRFVKSVPFTKLKMFDKSASISDPKNVLIITEQITDSNLYNIIMYSNAVYSKDGVKIFKLVK